MRSSPIVTQELLDYLDEKFPNKCPGTDLPMEEVRALAGSIRVVDHLKKCYREQASKALRGDRSNTVVLSDKGE